MKRKANAVWSGSIKEGQGKITTQSTALDNQEYSFNTRFGDKNGTNPDELLAAAHAGCFAMALSLMLGEAGYTPETLDATAQISMDTDKLELTQSHLTLKAKIPGIGNDEFMECAEKAKDNCPVSKVLNCNITLDATLE